MEYLLDILEASQSKPIEDKDSSWDKIISTNSKDDVERRFKIRLWKVDS